MNLSPELFIVSGEKSTLIMRPVFGEYYKLLALLYEDMERKLKSKMKNYASSSFVVRCSSMNYEQSAMNSSVLIFAFCNLIYP